MLSPITQNLDVLKKAQQLDSEIHRAHLLLEEIPSERAQLKSELELEKIRSNELEKSLKDIQLKLRKRSWSLLKKRFRSKNLTGNYRR